MQKVNKAEDMKEEVKWYFENAPEYEHLSKREIERCFSDIDRLFNSYRRERLSPEDAKKNIRNNPYLNEIRECFINDSVCDSPNTADK